ncbi:MAG: preprotein translocase subunit SecY [Treponema sp.]|nr:preprotein translocase subunit SecY [Treponema sp.]
MAGKHIAHMLRIKELRDRLLFTFLVLIVFRLGSVITIPGVNPSVLFAHFEELARQNSNSFASYMDFFVGGAFSNFSVFMLGVMPYISAQIIMQLAIIIFPTLKRAVEEEGGRQKMASWTRMGTVAVCLIQSFAVTWYASSVPGCIVLSNMWAFRALAVLTVTTGSMITVWLGDQISSHGIGNGISMIIFAGIVARWPGAIAKLAERMKSGDVQLLSVIIMFLMFLGIIAVVVFEEAGERKIPVHYAKRVVGRKMYGGQNTYIPFKVNPSSVIPLIFASSLLTLPLQLISMFARDGQGATWVTRLSAILVPHGWVYNVVLVILIVFFAYFYTQVTLNPTEIAKNIRENGGSIPGVRTDRTEEYLQKILNRLVLPGALFLAAIAVLPTIIENLFNFPQSVSMLMGGTSIIIVVGVARDTMSQIEALLRMHHHDGLGSKGRSRSRSL